MEVKDLFAVIFGVNNFMWDGDFFDVFGIYL